MYEQSNTFAWLTGGQHKPSSVGSMSPRSCDAWSQGSDSSPSRINHSPVSHNHNSIVHNHNSVLNNHADSGSGSGSGLTQSAKHDIMSTSPARRKCDELPTSEDNSSSQTSLSSASPARIASSLVCRTTPPTSQVTEQSLVTIDNQSGTVKWIGYEMSKPGRYFAGVKMASIITW